MKWLVAVFMHPVILSSVKNNKLILSLFIMLTEALKCLMQSNEYSKKYGQRQVQLIEHFIEHWESPGKVLFPFFTFPCLMKIHLLWLHRRRRNKRELSFLFLLSSPPKHLRLSGGEADPREPAEGEELAVPTSKPLPQSETLLSPAARRSPWSKFWNRKRRPSIPGIPVLCCSSPVPALGGPTPLSPGRPVQINNKRTSSALAQYGTSVRYHPHFTGDKSH